MSHTQSPWKFVIEKQVQFEPKTGKAIENIQHWIKSGEQCLAVLCAYNRPVEKNGFLIAAAPNLLEALEKAHLEILNFLKEGDFKREVHWDAGYIVAAIAKARGER